MGFLDNVGIITQILCRFQNASAALEFPQIVILTLTGSDQSVSKARHIDFKCLDQSFIPEMVRHVKSIPKTTKLQEEYIVYFLFHLL